MSVSNRKKHRLSKRTSNISKLKKKTKMNSEVLKSLRKMKQVKKNQPKPMQASNRCTTGKASGDYASTNGPCSHNSSSRRIGKKNITLNYGHRESKSPDLSDTDNGKRSLPAKGRKKRLDREKTKDTDLSKIIPQSKSVNDRVKDNGECSQLTSGMRTRGNKPMFTYDLKYSPIPRIIKTLPKKTSTKYLPKLKKSKTGNSSLDKNTCNNNNKSIQLSDQDLKTETLRKRKLTESHQSRKECENSPKADRISPPKKRAKYSYQNEGKSKNVIVKKSSSSQEKRETKVKRSKPAAKLSRVPKLKGHGAITTLDELDASRGQEGHTIYEDMPLVDWYPGGHHVGGVWPSIVQEM